MEKPIGYRRSYAGILAIGRNFTVWIILLPILTCVVYRLIPQERDQPPQFALVSTVKHASSIAEVQYSRDGRRLATADFDGNVRIWDRSNLREFPNPPRHAVKPAIAFSPDGEALAIVGNGSAIRFWSIGQAREGSPVESGVIDSTHLEFTPDGKLLGVMDGPAGSVELREIPSGRVQGGLRGREHGILHFAFSPDGRLAALAGKDGTIRLVDVSTGLEIQRIEVKASNVASVAFSPDGSTLASSGPNNVIFQLWGVADGNFLGMVSETSQLPSRFAFAPDGDLFVAIPKDSAIRSFDMKTFKERTSQRTASGKITLLAISPDGREMATGGNDYSLRVWDLRQILVRQKIKE